MQTVVKTTSMHYLLLSKYLKKLLTYLWADKLKSTKRNNSKKKKDQDKWVVAVYISQMLIRPRVGLIRLTTSSSSKVNQTKMNLLIKMIDLHVWTNAISVEKRRGKILIQKWKSMKIKKRRKKNLMNLKRIRESGMKSAMYVEKLES